MLLGMKSNKLKIAVIDVLATAIHSGLTSSTGTCQLESGGYAISTGWLAFDQDLGTEIRTGNTLLPGSIRYDFVSPQRIGFFRYMIPVLGQNPTDFTIETSDDGVTWVERMAVTNSILPQVGVWSEFYEIPKKVYAKYIRMNITSLENSGGDRVGFTEFELYTIK